MGNPQLLDYVTTQLRMGVSPEAIRAALVEVGWPETEVRDAFGNGLAEPQPRSTPPPEPVAQPVQQPISRKIPVVASDVAPMNEPRVTMASARAAQSQPRSVGTDVLPPQQPMPQTRLAPQTPQAPQASQTISFGDIRPQTNEPMFRPQPSGQDVQQPAQVAPEEQNQESPQPPPQQEQQQQAPAQGSGKLARLKNVGSGKPWIMRSVLSVVIVGVSAAAVYFFLGQNSLNKRVGELTGERSRLQGQLEAAVHERDEAKVQLATLRKENAAYEQELTLFGYTGSTDSVPADVSGTLREYEDGYALFTQSDLLIVIEDSAIPPLYDVLEPLVGSLVQLKGTHIADGTGRITVEIVNGEPVTAAEVPAEEVSAEEETGM